MTTLLATAALVVLTAANHAGGKAGAVGAVATQDKLRTPKPKRKQPAACVSKLRHGVAERRVATWKHEDALSLPRTPSAFREREARGCDYLAWIKRTWHRRAIKLWPVVISVRTSEGAIRYVFGPYAEQALAIARCESGRSMTPRAHNGQYLGMFQMGSSERRIYGHGPDRLTQAKAAHRYFVASGRDWSPWSCRWAAGF